MILTYRVALETGGVQPWLEDFTLTSLDEASLHLPQGAYTTFRTYDGKRVFRLQLHFDRLDQSARLADQALGLNQMNLRKALRSILAGATTDFRVRITCDLSNQPGSVFVSTEVLHLPSPDDYELGVKAQVRQMHRDNPEAKLTRFILTAADLRAQMPADVNEILMVGEDGTILEGLSSNFFCILQGRLFTADQGVLKGITRSVVLEEAHAAGIEISLSGVTPDELTGAQECFITSISRDVLPVVRVSEQKIGSGTPGPISKQLLQRYRARIAAESETI